MIFSLFRRDPRQARIEALYRRIAEASRDQALYADLGVPDTVEGRFEAVALHVVVVLRRLRKLPAPAGDVAQDLVDHFFAQMDATMRESGVGDMGVPKRMKKLAAAFFGRAAAYDRGLEEGEEATLAAAFASHGIGAGADQAGLARYAIALDKRLAQASLEELLDGGRDLKAVEVLEEAGR
jgi:cytochrome b pre-mRNA-processing protein 3